MKKILSAVLFFALTFCVCACVENKSTTAVDCKLSAEYDGEKIIGSVSYANYGDYLLNGALTFNLYPNKMNETESAIEILSVRKNDEIYNFEKTSSTEKYFIIDDASGEITIDFQTRVDKGTERLSSFFNGANISYFFPHIVPILSSGERALYDYTLFGDPFYDAFCNFECEVTVPSTMAIACGAMPIGCDVKGEKTTYKYELNNAKTFAFCLNLNYEVISKKWSNKCVNYYYCEDETPRKTFETIISALDFLSANVGELLYDNLVIAQTELNCGGMEYPALCMVGKTDNRSEYLYAVVHEIAHQYFPVTVDLNQYENAFFDEGFAEYAAMKFFEEYDYDFFSERLFLINASVNAFKRAIDSGKTNFKSDARRNLCDFSCEYEYITAAYRKGFSAFYQVEKQIGEKTFFTAVSNFLKNNSFQNADLQDFYASFSRKSKTVEQIFLKNLT